MKRKMKVISAMIFVFFVFASLYATNYGAIYITNNANSQTASTSWQDITDYSNMIVPSGCTATAHGITTGTAAGSKQYLVRYSLSFYGDAALWKIGIKIGTDTPRGIIERRISTSGTDVGNAAGSFIATIPQDTAVSFQIAADSGTPSYTAVHSQMVIVELTESSNPKYAEMSIVNNTVAQTPITNFTNLQNFSDDHATLDGWIYSTNTITASNGSAGTYLVILSASFNGTTGTNYELGISKDGSVPYGGSDDTEIVLKRYLGTSGDIGNGGACGIVTISEGDEISVQASSSGNITVEYASLTLVKIDGSVTPPYAGMKVEDNTNTISLPQSTWVPESNFTSDILHNSYWDFTASGTSDELTPKSTSGGDYLVNYYLSVEVDAGTPDASKTFNTLISLFNNDSQLNDLTTERTLEKKQTAGNNPDVAAINGTAIIRIENLDDALYLQLQNVDQSFTMDPIIRYANVSLFRIATINDGALPVSLSSFEAIFENNRPHINWTTQTESSNAYWNIYRSISQNLGQSIHLNATEFIEGAGSTSEPTSYTFTDYNGVEGGYTYYYWIESVSYAGDSEMYGPVSLFIPESGSNFGIPDTSDNYGLYQNFPNPFNPSTSISFALDIDDKVELIIYNLKGEKVRTIFSDHVYADQINTVIWNGDDRSGKQISSGVYLYKLKTTSQEFNRKMILVK